MGDTYGDMEKAKSQLDLTGITTDNAKLEDAANQVDSYLGSEFIYVLGDTLPFESMPEWFKALATEGYEAFYWFKQNNDDKLWKEFKEKVQRDKTFHFQNPAAVTR